MFGLPFELTLYQGDFIAISTFLMSVQYNWQNFVEGFMAANDKVHAVFCMLPFF